MQGERHRAAKVLPFIDRFPADPPHPFLSRIVFWCLLAMGNLTRRSFHSQRRCCTRSSTRQPPRRSKGTPRCEDQTRKAPRIPRTPCLCPTPTLDRCATEALLEPMCRSCDRPTTGVPPPAWLEVAGINTPVGYVGATTSWASQKVRSRRHSSNSVPFCLLWLTAASPWVPPTALQSSQVHRDRAQRRQADRLRPGASRRRRSRRRAACSWPPRSSKWPRRHLRALRAGLREGVLESEEGDP